MHVFLYGSKEKVSAGLLPEVNAEFLSFYPTITQLSTMLGQKPIKNGRALQ